MIIVQKCGDMGSDDSLCVVGGVLAGGIFLDMDIWEVGETEPLGELSVDKWATDM